MGFSTWDFLHGIFRMGFSAWDFENHMGFFHQLPDGSSKGRRKGSDA